MWCVRIQCERMCGMWCMCVVCICCVCLLRVSDGVGVGVCIVCCVVWCSMCVIGGC